MSEQMTKNLEALKPLNERYDFNLTDIPRSSNDNLIYSAEFGSITDEQLGKIPGIQSHERTSVGGATVKFSVPKGRASESLDAIQLLLGKKVNHSAKPDENTLAEYAGLTKVEITRKLQAKGIPTASKEFAKLYDQIIAKYNPKLR